MRTLFTFLALAAAACFAADKPQSRSFPLLQPAQIMDASYSTRHNAKEVEVVILNLASKQMTFQLERKPIAKITPGYAFRLYLSPGDYRFGIVPTYQVPLTAYWEMRAGVTGKETQLYRIFQSSGFTSSGGNAGYEIAYIKERKP